MDTKKLLNNYSVVEGSRAKALEAVNVKKQTRYNNDQENLGGYRQLHLANIINIMFF